MKKITINEFFASKEKLAIYPKNKENLIKTWKVLQDNHYFYCYEPFYYYSLYECKICFGNDSKVNTVNYYKKHGYTIVDLK
jgi:hypothetical protein